MQNKQQELNKILSRIDELEPQRRALNDEYMVIRCELEDLKDRKDELENEIWGMESEEMLKEEDNTIDKSFNDQFENPMDSLRKLSITEENQLIDEINNPDDYVSSDTKDLESSIA